MRRWCALVLAGCALGAAGPARTTEKKADPAAAKLLAEARAARATWEGFPGFTADVAVNLDGQEGRGKVVVDAKGNVTLTGLDKDAKAWARRLLGSIVGHRGAGPAREAECAFGDAGGHPLGRSVEVLGDAAHSRYRIRDKQVLVVERRTEGQRFTITVLENTTNKEGKYLPAHYTVSYWDLKSGALRRSVANHQAWVRVGRYDLPAAARAVTSTPEAEGEAGLTVRCLKLTNHRLAEKAAAK